MLCVEVSTARPVRWELCGTCGELPSRAGKALHCSGSFDNLPGVFTQLAAFRFRFSVHPLRYDGSWHCSMLGLSFRASRPSRCCW